MHCLTCCSLNHPNSWDRLTSTALAWVEKSEKTGTVFHHANAEFEAAHSSPSARMRRDVKPNAEWSMSWQKLNFLKSMSKHTVSACLVIVKLFSEAETSALLCRSSAAPAQSPSTSWPLWICFPSIPENLSKGYIKRMANIINKQIHN